ncbi:CG3907 [Drosophila busckii]|uniref:CG3907 n=1 Tax=Drosophila busckii TaxID=30019 RepID=A0A0M4EET4_DROBS|nr:uncharacterized protein LOC108596079 [Drosophila busckii]ALC42652.1 CG3907 [Drosophila busckii]
MECHHRIEVPLRSGGGKKMKKRRELDALIAHSLTKRDTRRAVNSQDKLLSVSTDDPEDYAWVNTVHSTRRNHRKKICFRKCGSILFGITTALFVGILYWLYIDLRQQISDYRQKIEEVSVIGKIFPDTLQQWHETTSFLIKNQTSVTSQIYELTRNVELLGTNFSSLQSIVSSQGNYIKDEKLVADFGAKLEAVATDIEGLKEHFNKNLELQKNLELKTEDLKANMSQLSILQSSTPQLNFSNEMSLLNQTMQNAYTNFKNNLVNVNNTMSQTVKMLNGEIQTHKLKLDDLLDRSQNITSHVETLSNSWSEFKEKIILIDEQLNNQNKEIIETAKKNRILVVSIEQLKALYKKHTDSIVTVPILEEANTTEAQHNKINITSSITTIKANRTS